MDAFDSLWSVGEGVHTLFEGHEAIHGIPKVKGPGALLGAGSMFVGGMELLHGLHASDPFEIMHGAASAASGLASGLGYIGGHTALGACGAYAAPVLGSLATGMAIGHGLDEAFGISDQISGPSPAEEAGYVNMKRGDIAAANRQYLDDEVERLRHVDEAPLLQMPGLFDAPGNENRVGDPRLDQAAKAVYLTQREAERQQELSESISARHQVDALRQQLFMPFAF